MVISRVGALLADSESGAETNYRVVPKTNAEMGDAAFNRSAIRDEIVGVTLEVISFICQDEGDPRRIPFRLTTNVLPGGTLPSSMGPYGAITDAATGRPLVPRSASEIQERVTNADNLWTVPVFFFAIDGAKLFHTVANAAVEYFDYPRPATTYSALDTLFGSMANFFPLGDEFAVVVADGAAGRLCMKAGSLVGEGQAFLQAYAAGLKERGVSVQPADFPAQPSS
jgi:hypothetical protein